MMLDYVPVTMSEVYARLPLEVIIDVERSADPRSRGVVRNVRCVDVVRVSASHVDSCADREALPEAGFDTDVRADFASLEEPLARTVAVTADVNDLHRLQASLETPRGRLVQRPAHADPTDRRGHGSGVARSACDTETTLDVHRRERITKAEPPLTDEQTSTDETSRLRPFHHEALELQREGLVPARHLGSHARITRAQHLQCVLDRLPASFELCHALAESRVDDRRRSRVIRLSRRCERLRLGCDRRYALERDAHARDRNAQEQVLRHGDRSLLASALALALDRIPVEARECLHGNSLLRRRRGRCRRNARLSALYLECLERCMILRSGRKIGSETCTNVRAHFRAWLVSWRDEAVHCGYGHRDPRPDGHEGRDDERVKLLHNFLTFSSCGPRGTRMGLVWGLCV